VLKDVERLLNPTAYLETMESYRSLAAWQRAHEAVLIGLRASDQHYQPRARALFDQFRRAVISVDANIVEGYALRTPLLFRKHLRIALGSAAEAECLLRVCGELSYLPGDTITDLQASLDGTIRTLVGFLRKPVH
jgi:four helix bundle protein